jgi:hypothetical protein
VATPGGGQGCRVAGRRAKLVAGRRAKLIAGRRAGRKKDFFFEKKKQKTFAPESSPLAHRSQPGTEPGSKSFLVPFVKKEHFLLLCLPLPRRAIPIPCPPRNRTAWRSV